MSYQSESIATAVDRLNRQYFLPAIQREFVWDPSQVIQLFDSILRGYPIGSFLFWDLKPESMEKWEVYGFIQNAGRERHNARANVAAVPQLNLILDGQQRLTSLLVGLKGSYTIKRKYKRWDDPDAWERHHLYLDLLKDAKDVKDDGEEGVYYGLQFASASPSNDDTHWWLKLGRILAFDSEDRFYEWRQNERSKLPDTVTKGAMNVFERNLDRLYRAIWKDDAIAYYEEHDQDIDRVLDIFVRANAGGTKLSKSDLLLSMITSKWAGMNAREEIYDFVDRLNNELTRGNDLDKDFVMKTCLVASDLPVAYKIANFNNKNLELIRTKWDGIKSAIERTVDLVNSFGIDRDTLTSSNALIPIVYYLAAHPHVLFQGGSQFEASNADALRRWLIAALLNNVFGGQSDSTLRECRDVLTRERDKGLKDFPLPGLNDALAIAGKNPRFDDVALNNFLDVTYGRMTAFLAVSLLYDERGWGNIVHHLDHIFPKKLFGSRTMKERGIPADRQRRFLELMNRIGNLELLMAPENQEKSGKPFDEWITTRDHRFRRRHLIPEDDSLLAFDRFEEFIEAREGLIRKRLGELFALPEGAK